MPYPTERDGTSIKERKEFKKQIESNFMALAFMKSSITLEIG